VRLVCLAVVQGLLEPAEPAFSRFAR